MTAPLGIVILAVDHVPTARDFYTSVFGWTVRVDAGVFVQLSLPSGPDVGLYARDGFAKNTGLPTTPVPVGHTSGAELYLFPNEPLQVVVDRALAAGARLLSPPTPRMWGDTVAYLADPSGHVVAVARAADAASTADASVCPDETH